MLALAYNTGYGGGINALRSPKQNGVSRMPSKEITLSKGFVTIVDDADYVFLMQWKWSYVGNRYGNKYAVRKSYENGRKNPIHIIMHRLIMGNPEGMSIDHINGNGLDNRHCNLRICTHKQNTQSKIKRKNAASAYKGVTWIKEEKLWKARIGVDYKRIILGKFHSEIEAALAYNEAALKYHGEFAKINEGVI